MRDAGSMSKAELVAEAASRGLGTPAALSARYRSHLVDAVREARKDDEESR